MEWKGGTRLSKRMKTFTCVKYNECTLKPIQRNIARRLQNVTVKQSVERKGKQNTLKLCVNLDTIQTTENRAVYLSLNISRFDNEKMK